MRDRVTRGGPAVRGNANGSAWFYVGTDSRKALSLYYDGYYENDGRGTVRKNMIPSMTWRPTPATSVSVGFRYNTNDDDSQWVANEEVAGGEVRYVFGRLTQRTAAFTFRVNYTMTPDLSLQSYAEPFVSAGDYAHYKRLVDGRAARYEDRYRPYDYPESADFTIRSFRTTNVLRWEYRPGSALFFVCQQSREGELDAGRFNFGRDFRGVFSTPAQNVFLVKLSYWFNL